MLNLSLNRIKPKTILIFYIFLFMISFTPNISASCSEGQININNASKEELDEIYGIGPVKAQNIIDTRPFDSIDDLIKVNGIGQITLDKIKNQDLACVEEDIIEEPIEETSQQEENQGSLESNDESNEETSQQEENQGSLESNDESNEETSQQEEKTSEENNLDEIEEIKLNEVEKQNKVSVINLTASVIDLTKNIKTKDSNENTSRTYAIYGFIVFCILLIVLFILRKNRFENEFG